MSRLCLLNLLIQRFRIWLEPWPCPNLDCGSVVRELSNEYFPAVQLLGMMEFGTHSPRKTDNMNALLVGLDDNVITA